jgi:hypothetical protein
MIKKTAKILWVFIFLLVYVSGYAEPLKLKDASEIIGVWKVVATAPTLQKEKKKTNEKWEFKKDGSFVLKAVDHRAKSEMHTKTKYTVENGLIKVANPGRPGKFFIYQVYEKAASSMTLKGGLEGFYFLEKK